MITVQDFRSFQQIAEELTALFEEGTELSQTYPLLRRWQEILDSVPRSERASQPWIIVDMPTIANQSYCVWTFHPTKQDDNWRAEWMPSDISADEEQVVGEHLRKMFNAWLRAVKRDERNGAKTDATPIGYVTLSQCAGMVNRTKRTLERAKQEDTSFPTPEIIADNGEADEWLWTTIRPFLQTKYKRKLPEIHPAHVQK